MPVIRYHLDEWDWLETKILSSGTRNDSVKTYSLATVSRGQNMFHNLQFGNSSHDNFFNSIFVYIKRKFENPAVWSFLEFLKVVPMGKIFPEILNLCEVRKFCDDPASRSANWDQVN